MGGRRDKQVPKHTHAGNGTVNHGPEGDQGPKGLDPKGLDLDVDERALRRMLHQSVQEIEPRDDTLEHLRRAVPARRARKRHAAIGMASAALFIGTAVPALVHVSNSTGSDADPSMVGHRSQAQGGAGQAKGESSGSSPSDEFSGPSKDTGEDSDKGKDKDEESKGETGGATGASAEVTASDGSTPACTAAELGGAGASVAPPDSAGAVYGTFRVVQHLRHQLYGHRRGQREHGRRRARPTPPGSAWRTMSRATRPPDCPTRPWPSPSWCCGRAPRTR